jgi:TusA-related sulfurtransferase
MTLNLNNEVCPMAFVKVKVALYELEKGDTLEVLISSEETVKNICTTLKEENINTKVEVQKDGVYKIKI